jgi:hypothetical protein
MEKPVDIPAPPAAICHEGTPMIGRDAALDMPREGESSAEKSFVARTVGVRTANRHWSARINVLR